MLIIQCTDSKESDFNGPFHGILWGFTMRSFGTKYLVEAIARWGDESETDKSNWHAVSKGSWKFRAVGPFVEKALTHESVYIRVAENAGQGTQYYAKFELDGLEKAIGQGRELCETYDYPG